MTFKEKRMGEKILDILLDILIIIFGIILLVSIYNNIQIKIFKNDYSSLFGYSTFEVKTGSMAHEIEVGDYIIVKYSNDIKLNDIITYKKDDAIITHRVIEKYNNTYITKGDANNTKDEPVSSEQIIGKVVKVLPHYGIIRKTILNPIVLIALIISVYLISYTIRNLKNNKNDNSSLKEKLDNIITSLINKVNEKEKVPVKKTVLEVVETRTLESETLNKEESNTEDEKDDSELENNDDIIDEDEEEIIPLEPEDVEKTMFFRMISVNKDDVSGAYKKNKNKYIEEVTEDSNISDEELETKTDKEVKKCITQLKAKKKKFKNLIDKIMYIKEDEINSIINIFNSKEKQLVNESTIKETLLKTYIYAKYYGLYENEIISYGQKSSVKKINEILKIKAEDMISKYKGNDKLYEDKVDKYIKYFKLINIIEYKNTTLTDIPSKRETYKNELLPVFKSDITSGLELMDMVNKIIIVQKVHSRIINESLNKLDSNTFELLIEQLGKDMYAINLKHNITFSKIYSDYIVDKTYTEGIIAEDKAMITVTMIVSILIDNMFSGELKNKYFIYIPGSMYEKRNKLEKIFGMFDDDFARNNIVVVNDFDEVVKNKKAIKELKKKGYKFAIAFNEESTVNQRNASAIGLSEYIIVDKNTFKSLELNNYIPEELNDNIINDDAYSKIIDGR